MGYWHITVINEIFAHALQEPVNDFYWHLSYEQCTLSSLHLFMSWYSFMSSSPLIHVTFEFRINSQVCHGYLRKNIILILFPPSTAIRHCRSHWPYLQFMRLHLQISLFLCDLNKSDHESDVCNFNLSLDHAVHHAGAGEEVIPEILVIKCTCTCPPSSFSEILLLKPLPFTVSSLCHCELLPIRQIAALLDQSIVITLVSLLFRGCLWAPFQTPHRYVTYRGNLI